MNNHITKKYVLTGGLCSGKTTTLQALKKLGFEVFEEAASTLVAIALAAGSQRPPKNTTTFQEAAFAKQKAFESDASGIAFFDRSVIDILIFCKFHNIAPPKDLQAYISTHRYNKVFLFKQLPFYEQCATRQSPKEKYANIDLMLKKAYNQAGYDVVIVPYMSVKQRVDFILKSINSKELL